MFAQGAISILILVYYLDSRYPKRPVRTEKSSIFNFEMQKEHKKWGENTKEF